MSSRRARLSARQRSLLAAPVWTILPVSLWAVTDCHNHVCKMLKTDLGVCNIIDMEKQKQSSNLNRQTMLEPSYREFLCHSHSSSLVLRELITETIEYSLVFNLLKEKKQGHESNKKKRQAETLTSSYHLLIKWPYRRLHAAAKSPAQSHYQTQPQLSVPFGLKLACQLHSLQTSIR